MFNVYWSDRNGLCWSPILSMALLSEEAKAVAILMKSLRTELRWAFGPDKEDGFTEV